MPRKGKRRMGTVSDAGGGGGGGVGGGGGGGGGGSARKNGHSGRAQPPDQAERMKGLLAFLKGNLRRKETRRP